MAAQSQTNLNMQDPGGRAREIFRNAVPSLKELQTLTALLRRLNQLDDARRLLEIALFTYSLEADEEVRLKLLRDLILCTYKDPDLPADTRLRQAEQMLCAVLGEPLDAKGDPPHSIILALRRSIDHFPRIKQDLLGIAGTVQKRRWDTYGLRIHLIRSYQYYRRGYEMGCE